MTTFRYFLYVFVLLFPFFGFSKIDRRPATDPNTKGIKGIESAIKNVEADVLKAPEVTQNQKSFFTAISYSLFSPTFDSEVFKNQNQESLGTSILFGYSSLPFSGLGFQSNLGLMQNSKTDRSLPDFVMVKPSASLSFSVSRSLYFTGGLFNYLQQGQNLKNFQSYIGQEFFVGFKANKTINIKFGYSFSRFSSDFTVGKDTVNSLVSLRGLESQLIYLF